MSTLFEPVELAGIHLRNRFVRSATHDACAAEGMVTERKIALYRDLARGGVGLIIADLAVVHPTGWTLPHQASIQDDAFIPGWRRLVDEAHRHGARIALQLFHGGRQDQLVLSRGLMPLAPSLIEADPYFKGECCEIDRSEIEELVHSFGQAGRRAREAGFDAVQLHGAHGYLFSQFLSPYTNRRRDEWGGSLEGRLRFHLAVLEAIRRAAGADYPVLIKLGVQDGMTEGLRLQEGCRAAHLLAASGFAAIEVSLGHRAPGPEGIEFRRHIKSPEGEAYYLDWARQIRPGLPVPLMLVGGVRSLEIAERIMAEGSADFISLSRPLIREPGIVNRWQSGDRRPSACISCNLCLRAIAAGEPLECIQRRGKQAAGFSQPASGGGRS